MTIRTLTPRNLLVAALLLCIAGCGCNDDSSPPGSTNPLAIPAVLGIKTQVPPIPVTPPPDIVQPVKIDIAFVLDDGDNMIDRVLGIIPSNLGDNRSRMQATQAIFNNIQANIQARFNQEWVAQHPGTTPPPLDLAFAVTRFEDFGGPFTKPNRAVGDVDDPANQANDRDARPFILNMPILRIANPSFAPLFTNAMLREAPGDGHPLFTIGIDSIRVFDPQTAVEALYQLAAPTAANGNVGGFDADKDGNSQGSGLPTGLDPARNPQTLPGASGDVPAIRFLANGNDADGHPLFSVADETGAVVTIPDPLGIGGPVPSPASGNLGQAGWREDAARFAVLASSIATVCPTETPPLGTPELPGVLPPPADSETVSSTAGAPTAPREARTTLLGAFDGGPLVLTGGTPITERRTGVPDDDRIAPVGAHTVRETISRLNALDVEVLFLGCPFLGGLDTKPGVPGVNGDLFSHIEADDFDPTDAAKVQPDLAPWFFMNAANTLTMPPVTSIPRTGRATPALFAGDDSLFWAVYNMGTVWPFVSTDPNGTDETNILGVIPDDIAERIVAWIDGGFVVGGTTPAPRPPLPTVAYVVTLQLGQDEDPNASVIQVAPLLAGAPKTFFTQVVQVPTYYSDTPAPADVVVSFPLPVDGPFQFTEANDTIPLPAQKTFPFEMTATFDSMGNMLPGQNEPQQLQIVAFIKLRGDGFTVDGGGNIVPLANVTDTIIQAQAAFTVIVRDSLFPGPGAQLASVIRGCAIINDLTPGQNASDQVGGTCPFPPAPVVP